MKKRSWKSMVFAGAVAVALAIVLNPEVRAIMLLAEALGFDVLVLLLATQSRSIFPMLSRITTVFTARVCKFGAALSGHALQASLSLPPFRLFAVLLSPLLPTLAFLTQCNSKITA